MILNVHFLKEDPNGHPIPNPDDCVTVSHKIEAWSGQDNKAKLIDDETIKLIAIGIRHREGKDDMWCAFEYNSKWGFL
jgi:hypothetical protein